ncbi:hypothetical protein N7447_003440 [Penicillium robsamsonii]|uniref:uncharacterized protein n=1 Tax=Penicillium robsamsonii TaxID=1792511 RepID=UPI002546D5D0|nr:uncharacterized protein N7447_003440 [Penicillium robsamsonii]KAJ5826677.1 hypothetical protein N7447_003440 [Penicillium robsamsonii]
MRVQALELGVLANLAISVCAFAVGRNSFQVSGPVASTSAPPSSSPTGDAWKTKQCSQIHGSPADQWQQAGAKSAWDATIAAWTSTPGDNSFPLFVSNHTDGPDGMRCSDMSSENRCAQPVQCEDAIPAVAMILNGFTGIHQLHASVFQAIGLAQASVTNNVGTFTSAFAPQRKDDSANIKMIIDAAMLVVSFGTSMLYNVVLQSAVNVIGKAIAQDMTGAILATSVTYYKTNMKGALEGLAEQNTIDTFVGKTMDEWKNAETSYLRSIFAGGDPSAIDALYATINNGTIAAAMDRLDLTRTSTDVEKILYGQMISYAWTVSGDRARPFIWRSSEYCDETTMPLSRGGFVERSSLSKIYVCHNNRMHLLLNAHKRKGTGFSSDILPGGEHDTLNGKDYGGITIDDIVISSVDGWSKNNYQNGYPKADVDSVVASFGGDNAPSVRSAGFFNLPICLNSNTAEENIRNGWNKESPYWPCENPEGYTSTGTNIRVKKGCVLFNDAKRCQNWGGPYNVADQNTPNSTVTIYAMFKGTSEKLVDKEVPGCKLVGSWPRDWSEMHFSEDNCLEDENKYYRQCCGEDTKTTDLVNNPYGPSW